MKTGIPITESRRKSIIRRLLQSVIGRVMIGSFGMIILPALLLSTVDSNGISPIFRTHPVAFAQNQHDDKPDESDAEAAAKEQDRTSDAASEIRIVLDGLEKKRLSLRKEKQKIMEDIEYVEALKREVEQKVETLLKIHQNIEKTLAKIEQNETEKQRAVREAKERNIRQLLKIYSNMKPQDVGAIIDRLEFQDAINLFMRMKDSKAAKILTYVDKDRAVKISEQLIAENGR